MRDGKGGAGWSSVWKLSGVIRKQFGNEALPHGETMLPYLIASQVWNNGRRTRPVPGTVAEAKGKLRVAHDQGWKVRRPS